MPDTAGPVRIFVGTDRSQLFACRVLEHSIRRHTDLEVEVTPMHELVLPQPRDPRNRARTGFSFARFAIPALAGHAGRALYLDADMLVFGDIGELWRMPFDGARVIVQADPAAGPKRRRWQCSVMVLDCGALDWDVEAIVAGLDGAYDYDALMNELCILDPAEISHALPFAWNSLEHYAAGETRLLHYTDMPSQPWVSPANPLGYLWVGELRRMLDGGAAGWREVEREIELGHFRPSLLDELRRETHAGPPADVAPYLARDRAAGFAAHAALTAELAARAGGWRTRLRGLFGRYSGRPMS